MRKEKKKRKWWKILIVLVIVIGLSGFGFLQVMDGLSQRALVKVGEGLSDQLETEQPAKVLESDGTDDGEIDFSYVPAIASLASKEEIEEACSAVLDCLSLSDKAKVMSYLANGQQSEAYRLVSSKISEDAYAVLVELYDKYAPMVQ